jgi:hypothetical protein
MSSVGLDIDLNIFFVWPGRVEVDPFVEIASSESSEFGWSCQFCLGDPGKLRRKILCET